MPHKQKPTQGRYGREWHDGKAPDGFTVNGVEDNLDCSCCGDRWCPVWGQGDDEPLIYDTHPAAYTEHFTEPGEVFCRVFYLDGRIAEFHKPAPFLIAGE